MQKEQYKALGGKKAERGMIMICSEEQRSAKGSV